MNIIRSRRMGFCAGVNNAVNIVDKAVKLGREKGKPVYTIGPLIHNEMFLARLEREHGVRVITSPDGVLPGIAVIRAHGLPADDRKAYIDNGFELVDGTCPRVLKSQELVRSFASRGWQILIAGNPDHGEVHALMGEALGYHDIHAVASPEYIPESLCFDRPIAVLSQTTYSPRVYQEITGKISEACKRTGTTHEIIDTICPSTLNRQEALRELMALVDAVIIIGGKQSANTRRLYELAELIGTPEGKKAWHVSRVDDLTPEMFQVSVVGITAGASTPEWLIDEISEALEAGER